MSSADLNYLIGNHFVYFWQSNTSTSAYAEVTCNTPNDNKYQDGKVETDIKN